MLRYLYDRKGSNSSRIFIFRDSNKSITTFERLELRILFDVQDDKKNDEYTCYTFGGLQIYLSYLNKKESKKKSEEKSEEKDSIDIITQIDVLHIPQEKFSQVKAHLGAKVHRNCLEFEVADEDDPEIIGYTLKFPNLHLPKNLKLKNRLINTIQSLKIHEWETSILLNTSYFFKHMIAKDKTLEQNDGINDDMILAAYGMFAKTYSIIADIERLVDQDCKADFKSAKGGPG